MDKRTKALLDAWVEHVAGHKWTWLVTLKLNQYSSTAAARTHFKRFCQYLDRDLIGPRYLKKPDQRVDIYAFSEHIYSNLHLHCFVKFRRTLKVSTREAKAAARAAWQKVIESGTVHFKRIYAVKGAARYTLKEMWRPERLDDIMHSRDFWPSQAVPKQSDRCADVDPAGSRIKTSRQHAAGPLAELRKADREPRKASRTVLTS
jgi:hypothetical protein